MICQLKQEEQTKSKTKMSIKQFLNKLQLVLDGALGTQLEAKFEKILIEKNLNIHHHPLWSARILINEPQLIQQIHLDYLLSGADMIMTATYQASQKGLKQYGGLTDEEVFKTYDNAISIAMAAQVEYREATKSDREIFLCASIGPYGAYLANGAEYTGDYSTLSKPEELIDFHHDMTKTFLLDDRVNVLAFETIPNFDEVKQILNLVEQLYAAEGKEKLFYLALNFADEEKICDGTSIAEVVEYVNKRISDSALLQRNLLSIGANCVKFNLANDIIANIAKANTLNIPLIAYPNAGLEYDLSSGLYTVTGVKDSVWREAVNQWTKNGVKIIGACCGSGPLDIAAIRKVIHL